MYRQTLLSLSLLSMLLSACTTNNTVNDLGTRRSLCIPSSQGYIQNSYGLQVEDFTFGMASQQLLTTYQPYLTDNLYQSLAKANNIDFHSTRWKSGELFSSVTDIMTKMHIESANDIIDANMLSTRLNSPISQADQKWQNEVLMMQPGECQMEDMQAVATWVGGKDGIMLKQLLNK